MKHCVHTDLPLKVPDNFILPDSIYRCFGTNCSEYAFGKPHRCPVGRCQRYEDAVIKLIKERK